MRATLFLMIAAPAAALAQEAAPPEPAKQRSATCWAASLKAKPKADGSEDWHFVRGLKLHDQDGRVAVPSSAGSRPVVLRMRNVYWQEGPNRPSLVLYVHTPDNLDRAVSYSWADPRATRVGINLRWMQASCTIDQAQEETKP